MGVAGEGGGREERVKGERKRVTIDLNALLFPLKQPIETFLALAMWRKRVYV